MPAGAAVHAAVASGTTSTHAEYFVPVARPTATAAAPHHTSDRRCAASAEAHTASAANIIVMPSGAIQRTW